ncbi:hypothetical protein GPM19_02325 [Halomonas sp. ZH2S]|uniref:HTH arsR-type domain-containing protein n=1 Tax=Vreelandella zhuhanensis TaxID=2684210 RepID=A0A7X3GYH1_9GAMM|nr:hypothetical protein [Halomonas zhuhanensis]MWJ27049.1 hypothetical protein [Halomonas zhuhanensis]
MPKVSRHLAQLRNCGLLIDRRDGQWVYYFLAPVLPRWIEDVLKAAQQGQTERLALLQNRLVSMGNRPERRFSMC